MTKAPQEVYVLTVLIEGEDEGFFDVYATSEAADYAAFEWCEEHGYDAPSTWDEEDDVLVCTCYHSDPEYGKVEFAIHCMEVLS